MTVTKLYNELGLLIKQGHGDTRVIADINFTSPWELKKGEYIGDFNLLNLDDVYYQSGDIELSFSDEKEG
ncbi:MAG: hypothetical protein J6Y78_09065 [Paludibacteraceae bacterium]|nr:hypothetical protein [Paludibacteraceae bacterium]